MRDYRVRNLLWIAVVFTAAAPAAFAQDADVDPNPDPEPALEGPHDPFGLGVKKLAYSTGLKVAEVFDDNILLGPDRKESDRITVALLKAKLQWESGRETAHVTYRARERLFADHSQFDGVEHFLDAAGSASFSWVRLEAGLDWKSLKDPFDALQVSGPVDSHFDREYIKAIADFNRFDLETTLARARFTIDDATLDRGDYLRREAALLGAADVGPQVAAFVELRIETTEYDESDFSDFTYTRAVAGIRGSVTPKIRTEARLGFGRADPDKNGLLPVETFTGLVASASGVWEIDARHELRVEIAREPMESILTGLAIADSVRFRYKYAFAERWSAQGALAWDRQRESDGSNERRGFLARAGVQWTFQDKVYADVGILYRTANGEGGALDYGNVRFSIGIGVEW